MDLAMVFHSKGMWSLEKSCTRVREKLMIFMVPKSHNSHLFHHDPPDCLRQSSTLIKPSKSSSRDSAYFFRARQFWIGQLSRAIPSDSGLKLRNSSRFGAGCDTMAFDKATESTLDSPSACGSGVGRGDIKGFLSFCFTWCLLDD